MIFSVRGYWELSFNFYYSDLSHIEWSRNQVVLEGLKRQVILEDSNYGIHSCVSGQEAWTSSSN